MWNPNISYRPTCNTIHNIPWYNKRKLKDEVPIDLPPPKILITEEKMVSQLKGIHLSNDYTSHDTGSTSSLAEVNSPLVGLKEKQTLPTLVMCDEIRALQKSVEPVLPKHILEKYQRPTNALVLWQPPVGDLGKYLKTFTQDNVESTDTNMHNRRPSSVTSSNVDIEMNEDDDNNNNNNVPSADLNGFFTRTI